MSTRKVLFSLVSCLFLSSIASAGSSGSIPFIPKSLHPVVSVFGGVAGLNVNTHSTQSFTGTDDEQFAYYSNNNNQARGLVGGFLGAEYKFPCQNLSLQAGIEYNYFSSAPVNGLNTVGIEPDTSSLYNYSWNVQTQQVLVVAKLLTTAEISLGTPHQFFPYLSVGLGAAFNNAKSYKATADESGSVNVAPTFNSRSQSVFSYSLGLGFEAPISQHVRWGAGYRFSDFGAASLAKGQVVVNQYSAPVSFALSVPHTYANQLIVELTYLA